MENIPIEILTFILDEDTTVETLVSKFLHEKARFKVTRFDNPEKFKNELEANPNIRLVLLDIELSRYSDYRILDMIKFLHREKSGTYMIVVAGFNRDNPQSFDAMKGLIRLGVFDLVDKEDETWKTDLQDALTRVTAKILYKINAVLK